MTEKEIVQALRRLRVETGSLACFGCGWEHDCGTHGCKILREAAARLEHFIAENRALRSALASRPAKRAQKQARDASVTFLREMAKELNAQRAEAEAERDALREKQRWIPVTERMPEERVLVNVVWVNRAPEPYYEKIKDVPFSGTACFYRENWYWDSPVVLDLLAKYGKDNFDLVDDAVEITHWMPLPKAAEEGEKA